MRKKAKNIAWSKLRGKHIAYNIHSFDLLVEFFQWMGDDFIDTRQRCDSRLFTLLGGNCDWKFTISIIPACGEKAERFVVEIRALEFVLMLWFTVFAIIEMNQNLFHGHTICNAANLFKLPPLVVNVLSQAFDHSLPQTQGFIGINLGHQLVETTIITSLPLGISYHVGFRIWIGIIFFGLSVFNVILN